MSDSKPTIEELEGFLVAANEYNRNLLKENKKLLANDKLIRIEIQKQGEELLKAKLAVGKGLELIAHLRQQVNWAGLEQQEIDLRKVDEKILKECHEYPHSPQSLSFEEYKNEIGIRVRLGQ